MSNVAKGRWASLGLLLIAVSCLTSKGAAQGPDRVQHVVYVEAFGNALHPGSVNYELIVTRAYSVRLGASPFGAFPVMVNYLPGRGDHSAEIGLGMLFGASDRNLFGTATIGYRYQPGEGGMVFRIGWTPLIGTAGVGTWGGCSIGFAF